MSTQPAIFELVNAPGFTFASGENIFRFLVALGDERDESVRQRMKHWLEFGIRTMPHVFNLIPLFAAYLSREFPLDRAADSVFLDESVKRLRRAQLGAAMWEPRAFVRLSLLLSALLTYEHVLKYANTSQTHSG